MITQKPISLKIDAELLQRLDDELAHTWVKRNTAINEAIRMYLELRDARAHEKYANSVGQYACPEALAFIKKHLVTNVHYYLDLIDHH